MKVNKTAVILISFFMLLGISFLGYYYTTMKQHPRRLPTYGNPGHKVGSFSFLNQDGKTITEKDLDGKIYVVVAVVLTILLGLIAYLIRLDRKISKLEKES